MSALELILSPSVLEYVLYHMSNFVPLPHACSSCPRTSGQVRATWPPQPSPPPSPSFTAHAPRPPSPCPFCPSAAAEKLLNSIHQLTLRDETARAIALLQKNAVTGLQISRQLADVDVVMGRTPLHIACERGNLKLVTFMVENGAPLDAIDKSGCTPFHYAAGYDTKEEWNKNVSYRSSITHGTADPHRPPPPARV